MYDTDRDTGKTKVVVRRITCFGFAHISARGVEFAEFGYVLLETKREQTGYQSSLGFAIVVGASEQRVIVAK